MQTVVYIIGAALIWLAYAGAHPASWLIGVPMIVAVVYVAHYLGALSKDGRAAVPHAQRLRQLGAYLKFATFFIVSSLRGAVDVSLRTLPIRMNISPVLFSYPTRLSVESDRVLLAAAITLMPGTLAAEIRNTHIVVHSLVPDPSMADEIARCEQFVEDLRPGLAKEVANV